MSDERSKPPIPDPDAPPSDEEIAASKRLREALSDPDAFGELSDDVDLVRSLRAAWSPDPIDEGEHATLVADMPLSDEELRLAGELREALEGKGGSRSAPDLALVGALRAAWAPVTLDEAEHRAILSLATKTLGAGGDVVTLRPRPARIAVVTATTLLALAASVVLWITTGAAPSEAPLAKARSTQPLFDEPFKAGETSARIDRISMARASDYRNNRFAKWGVR